MPQICLATTNQGKLVEFKHYLEPLGFDLTTLDDNYPDVPETGLTFIENALIKARAASAHYHMPVLADDSGICVPALNGAPGIYSARYAGKGASAQNNINSLLNNMKDLTGDDRQAFFYGALVFMTHSEDPTPIIATGRWHGVILPEQQGYEGFGYDPIFYIPELKCTAAQLSQSEKNKISHRGLALQQLQEALQQV
jgi:XTP/dITP diphosphohydrolase